MFTVSVTVDYVMMTDIVPCIVHCRVVSGRHGDVVTVQTPRCISDAVTQRQPSSHDDTLHTDNDLTLTDTCAQVAAQFFMYMYLQGSFEWTERCVDSLRTCSLCMAKANN